MPKVAKGTKVVAKQEAPAPSFSVMKGTDWIEYPYDEFERGLMVRLSFTLSTTLDLCSEMDVS